MAISLRVIWAVISGIICLLASFVYAQGDNDSLALIRADIRLNIEEFYVTDVNGDGINEFIEFPTDHRVIMVRQFVREGLIGPALYQSNFDNWLCSISLVEADTLPGQELAVAIRDNKGDSLWLEIYDGSNKQNILCKTEAVKGKNISNGASHRIPGWDGGSYGCKMADLDGDGDLEIVMPVIVGFDLYPRGIYAYDYPSGKLLWKFPLAGNPMGLSIADANKDGKQETYIKTWACFNGAEVNGRMDTAAYVFAIDYDGQEIWRQVLGDRFDFHTGEVELCDCDGDDTLEIYYTVLMASEKYDAHVRVLQKHRASDNLFLKQRSFDADQKYRNVFPVDLDGDGLGELVICDGPTILNPVDLSIIEKGTLSDIDVELLADIDRDLSNGLEIVVKKKDSLYVLSDELDILAAYQTEYSGHIRKILDYQSPFGKTYLGLLVTTMSAGIPNSMLYSLEVHPAKRRSDLLYILNTYRLFWPTVLIALVLGMPLGIIVYRSFIMRRPEKSEDITPYESLLSILASFDHGQMAGKNLNRLSFLTGNLPESKERLQEIKPNLATAIKTYLSFTQNQLSEISQYASKFKDLMPAVIELDRKTTELNEIIGGISMDKLDVEAAKSLTNKVPDMITEVKNTIKIIKKKIQNRFAADLPEVVISVFNAMTMIMKEKGVTLNIIIGKAHSTRPVFFVRRELVTILEELISNAMTSMESAENKIVTLGICFNEDEVFIKISDTGHGIKEQDSDRLFSRDFSTKKDGGFGLYYVQQQCEKFGADVSIYNNDDSPGTTVKLTLKAVDDAK